MNGLKEGLSFDRLKAKYDTFREQFGSVLPRSEAGLPGF